MATIKPLQDRIIGLLDDVNTTRSELQAAQLELTAMRSENHLARESLQLAQNKITSSHSHSLNIAERLEYETSTRKETQILLYNERRRSDRLQASSSQLRLELRTFLSDIISLRNRPVAFEIELQNLRESTSITIQELRAHITSQDIEIGLLKQDLLVHKRNHRLLQKKYNNLKNSSRALHAVSKAKHAAAKKSNAFSLRRKGVIRREVRQMARILVKAGCGQNHVSRVIQELGNRMGVNVIGRVSRRSVGRMLLEGGVSSELQLAYELKHATSEPHHSSKIEILTMSFGGFTLSSDGTSDKHVNYESRHVAYANPSTTSETGSHVIRMLDVSSSVDHTSETQFEGWKQSFSDLVELYNASPLARRLLSTLSLPELAKKIKGMNGDHASDQKKTFNLIGAWKHTLTVQDLGEQRMATKSQSELEELTAKDHAKKIEDIGGVEAWNSLSDDEKQSCEALMMESIALTIGEEVYQNLSEEDRWQLDLYLRMGCILHKDMNIFKYANNAMVKCHTESPDLPRPILLANRDNAATLSRSSGSTTLTEIEQRAVDVSGSGGVKATSIAGAIFNHKDDKKGQQDSHRIYFHDVKAGISKKFPNTSNIRYGSHGNAAAELLTYLLHYIAFLEHIKDKKEKRRLNHMEQNLANALTDIPTVTELAILALYTIFVSKPYVASVRDGGLTEINVLDLGPLHRDLVKHIDKLLANPDLLLFPEHVDEAEFLQGGHCKNTLAVQEIHALVPTLPNIRPLLIAFLTGAHEGAIHFSEEFIDAENLGPADRESAWMPGSNDPNEGALGRVVRISRRNKPVQTMHQNVAQAKYAYNHTQEFADNHLAEDEDESFSIKVARQRDGDKLETKRLEAIRMHEAELVKRKRDKDAARTRKAAEQAAAIASATLITDRTAIAKMTVDKLVEQLAILRQWDPSIRAKSYYKNKKDKHEALLAALDRFEAPKDTQPGGSELGMDNCGGNEGEEVEDDEFDEDDDELYHS